MLSVEAHLSFIIHNSSFVRGEGLLFYPQITLMTQIFLGYVVGEANSTAAEMLKA